MLFITPREREALRLVARSGTSAELAAGLRIDVLDVGSHLTELFSRMGASTPAEALACARHRGLLETTRIVPVGHQGMRRRPPMAARRYVSARLARVLHE